MKPPPTVINHLHSRYFSLLGVPPDADIGEPVVTLILRSVTFPHRPITLTRRELTDLRHLLRRWEVETLIDRAPDDQHQDENYG